MIKRIFVVLLALSLSGCIYGYQRAKVKTTAPDQTVTDIDCKQRQASFAAFGENNELHDMEGICGKFTGESSQVGFNEEGAAAFKGLLDFGKCIASSGASCALGRIFSNDEETD